MARAAVRVSIIIPTRDRPGALVECLRALANSFPSDAETIVVSDNGLVPLENYVGPFVEPLRLRCVTGRGRGPAAARNCGLVVAAGDVVCFTDDDCTPRFGWVDALRSGVSGSPPRAAGGTTVNGLALNPYADAAQLVLDLIERHNLETGTSVRFVPSNNIAFPTAVLRRVGGFDESFRTAEDRELCRRWLRAGFALHRIPEAIVEHRSDLNLRSFIRQFFTYGQGAARFHASAEIGSLRETARFHLRLPMLARRDVVARGFKRGSALSTLLIIWELSNLAGFVAAGVRPKWALINNVKTNPSGLPE
jgi:GT2 family glycosyltransferase